MRKIIKRKIQISTHKRDLIDFINDEFYSHDKHNAFLEFTMKSLPTDNIIALFYFQKTKRYVETKAFVDGDKFTIEFDTSLINTDETVLGFIYFEKVAQSADVHRFSFGVRVSEIDKLHDIPIEEAKTKRVVAIEDIVTKTELDELFKRIEKNGGTYNDTEIRNSISSISERVQTLENKPDNDTRYDDSDVKSRLSALESNSSRYLTEHQPLTSVEERIQQVEARFNNLSNIYLSSHQSLEHLATNDALGKIEQRVEQLEQNRVSDNHDFITRQELESKHYLTSVPEEYAKKTDLYNDSELRNKITQLETNSVTKEKVESVENRVQVLENKSVVTHEELEQAGYAKTTDLTNLAANSKVEAVESRVLALENKPTVIPQGYDDSALSGRVSALEAKQDKDTIYNDEEIKRRLTTLEGKTDNFISGVSVNKEGNNVTLTYNYVDGQTKNVSFTDSDTLNIAYDDSGLKARLTNLEERPQIDVSEFAKKTDIPQAYNDSELSRRVSALETKEDKDTVYNDEEIKRRLSNLEGKTDNFISGVSVNKEGNNVTLTYNYVDGQAKNVSFTDSDTINIAYDDSALKTRLTTLEERPQIDVSKFAKKSEVPTSESVANLTQKFGEQANKIQVLETKAGYAIHGTGMPNGRVTAPIGTTYIDTTATNGAIKWMKYTGDDNTGWRVIHGDTGWVLGWQEDKGKNKNRMYFRRINNVVHVKFEPKISDDVNAHEYNLILDTGGSDILGQLSIQGFQSVDNIVQTIFKRTIDIPGDTYSAENSEASQGCGAVCLHYVYNNDSKRELELHIVTSQFSSDANHVNPFSYLTEDEWPTEFPTL